MTLQQAVFAGLVDPGNLVGVREIVSPATVPAADCGTAAPLNCDTAVFVGLRSRYVITAAADGTVTVRDTTSAAPAPGVVVKGDGTDTLRNMEALKFSDQTLLIRTPATPTILTATASAGAFTSGTATVTWAAPAANGSAVTSYTVSAVPTTGATVSRSFASSARTATLTGLVNGRTYTLQVRAVGLFGASSPAVSGPVTPLGLPGAPTGVTGVRGDTVVNLSWTAPATDGGSAITGYQVQVRIGGVVVRTDPPVGNVTNTQVTGLTNGTAYTFRLLALNAFGSSAASAASASVTPATVPNAPVIAAVTQGAAGGTLTANVSWTAPTFNGGSAITTYTVRAFAVGGSTPLQAVTVTSGTRNRTFTFSTATPVEFDVIASNTVGDSLPSTRSASVIPR
jgi:hypothetical protein